MLQNEDVGRIDSVCPAVMAKATEVLLTQVIKDALFQVSKEDRKTVIKADIEKAFETYLKTSSLQCLSDTAAKSRSQNRKRKNVFVDDENGNVPMEDGSPF